MELKSIVSFNHLKFIAKAAGILFLTGFIWAVYDPIKADAGQYNRLPSTANNSPAFRAVVSTGTIKSIGTTGDSNINPFYSPEMWVKAYSDHREDQEFAIDVTGGPQKGDAGSGDSSECSDSDHHPKTRRVIDYFKTQENGNMATTGKIANSRDQLTSGDTCIFFRSLGIQANWWSAEKETESGKYTVLIRIKVEQTNNKDSDIWADHNGDRTSPNHRDNHPNHPSSTFILQDFDDSAVQFGNWGQYQGGKDLSDPNPLNPLAEDDRKHVFNTSVRGWDRVDDQLKRVFEFAPSCDYFPGNNTQRDVWLKWFDDDFKRSGNDGRTDFEMTVRKYNLNNPNNADTNPNNDVPAAGFVKTITGFRSGFGSPQQPGQVAAGEGFGGQGESGKAKITVEKGFKYKWTYKAANANAHDNDNRNRYGNRLAVWLPFDTAFSHTKDCDGGPLPSDSCTHIKFTTPNNPTGGKVAYRIAIKDGNEDLNGPEGGWDIKDPNVDENKEISIKLRDHGKLKAGDLKYRLQLFNKSANNPDGSTTYSPGDIVSDVKIDVGVCFVISCANNVTIPSAFKGQEPSDMPADGAVETQTPTTAETRVTNWSGHAIPNQIDGVSLQMRVLVNRQASTNTGGQTLTKNVIGISKDAVRFYEQAFTTANSLDSWYTIVSFGYPGILDLAYNEPGFGGLCIGGHKTYQPFLKNPLANPPVYDEEDPRDADYTTGVSSSGSFGPNVVSQVNSQLKRVRGGVETNVGSATNRSSVTLGTPEYNETKNVSSDYQFGDKYCSYVYLSRHKGYKGPGASDYLGVEAKSAQNCGPAVGNKPYVQAYGADVVAGSSFYDGSSCNSARGAINAYRSPWPDKSGSGVQFAAIAMDEVISQFGSASLRASDPKPVKGLSFGNVTEPYGGNYKGVNLCATDFYETTKEDSPENVPSSSINANGLAKGKQSIHSGDNFTITGGNNLQGKRTFYVNGNVTITSDISYGELGANFTLVVKGNIYIDKDVNNLDGIYIAQPKDDGTAGTVFTCTNDSALYPENTSALWNNCNSKLTVNGAVIAENISFLRTQNSLRDSTAREYTDTTKAAEVFNFSPEIYLFPPIFENSNSSSGGSYDYITTLPPVL